jgi:hypothetical protein
LEDDSRKDAKHAKYKQDYKFETRNPKFETISNGQKSEGSKRVRFGFRNWDLSLRFVSDFDIRISDFVSLAPWRYKFSCRDFVQHLKKLESRNDIPV